MLESLAVPFTYREYRDEPLTRGELDGIIRLLGCSPGDLLRPKEGAAAGLSPQTPPESIFHQKKS